MASRFASVTVALLGIAGLSAVLAVESVQSGYRYKTTTNQVLTDYASLGAEGLVNRLGPMLAGSFFAMLNSIPNLREPTRANFTEKLSANAARIASGVEWIGRLTPTGTLQVIGFDSTAVPAPGVQDSLHAAIARLTESAYMGSVLMHDANNTAIVFARPRPGVLAGAFMLPLAALTPQLQRFLENDPVLPQALRHGRPLGDGVEAIINIGGTAVAHRGAASDSPFRATQSAADILTGMNVEVRLAQSLAPVLVIGGVPHSRAPLLASIVALTLALALTGVYQLRQRERLTRMREDFVAGASHELRTPLAQIRLFAETLRLERVRNDDERMRSLTVIEREARRLEHLVENLLHYSRAERSVLQLAPEVLNVAALTREVVAEFAPLAAKAEVDITVTGPNSATAIVDAGAWRQIVINLLDNAAKYGSRYSRVTVHVERDGNAVHLTVCDEGPGVPVAERRNVWEKFWRGRAANDNGITGTGIGLSTVRDLVVLMGGTCEVDDAVPRGARFHVRVAAVA